MLFSSSFKHRFFSAFRELFVHHHGSLEFRAKLFALVIAANEDPDSNIYDIVKNLAIEIYENDEDRANLLVLSTQELVKKVKDKNGLDVDMLVANIQNELKVVPRYAEKINTFNLRKLINVTDEIDTITYQENILDFLETLKSDTLKKS